MDTPPIPLLLLAFLLALILSAFFSAAEAAFLSVQRYKIRSAAARGLPAAQRTSKLVEHPENFLPTVLVGNNLVNTLAASIGTLVAVQLVPSDTIGAVGSAVVVALILIIIGETLPKTLAARRAEPTAMTLSGPLIWAERVLGPIVFPVRGLNRWVSRLANPRGESVLATHEELKVLISLNRESGGLEETQARMLLRTLRLADLEVREVMTPRTEIVSITDEMTVADFLEFNARQFYSRFPVIRQGTEDVIGILAARDVLRALAAGDVSQSDPVTELATEAHFVWESKPVVDTIEEIRGGDHDMAIVVDEFGAMEGLVTLHQLLTEVVGGRRRPAATSASPGSSEILVKGSARVFDVNESLGIGLPDGEYDTVGGFVISRLDRLPKTGEKVTHGDWVLEVGKMAGPRVVEVRLCRLRTASREASPREVSPREASEPPSPTGAAR